MIQLFSIQVWIHNQYDKGELTTTTKRVDQQRDQQTNKTLNHGLSYVLRLAQDYETNG